MSEHEGQVLVFIENTYVCGQESSTEVWVMEPPAYFHPDNFGFDQWWDDVVHDLTGDGHPCGATEHALYEAAIVEAPGRPKLVGESSSWEG